MAQAIFPVPSAASALNYNVGATAARVNTAGYVLYNTFWNYPEIYDGTNWRKLSDFSLSPTYTGGTTTVSGGYNYIAFTASTTFSTSLALTCDVLVVGGGSGGSARSPAPGGGSGGSVSFKTGLSFPIGSYAVTVGAGGSPNNAGGTSTINTITTSGGNHSGASISGQSTPAGGTAGGATGTSAFSGGSSSGSRGGGGAGAGGNGYNGVGSSSGTGNGGLGINTYSTWLSATSLTNGGGGYFAAGGGGGDSSAGGGGFGNNNLSGSGVFGDGGYNGTTPLVAGSGGGGGYSNAGSGSSGLVIIRYAV